MSRATTKRSGTAGDGFDDNDDNESIPDLLAESTSSHQGSFSSSQQDREWFRDEQVYASDRDDLYGECKISKVDSIEYGSWEKTGRKQKDDNVDDDDLSIQRRRSKKFRLWPLAGGGLMMASAAKVAASFAGGKGTTSEVIGEDDLAVAVNWIGNNAVSAWGTEGAAVPPPIGGEAIAASQA